IFDCVFATPDMSKWRTLDAYPVVIAAGEIELSGQEGARLAKYVDDGGTLLVADGHVAGPGVGALGVPATGETSESDGCRWLDDPAMHPSPRFRYKPIVTTTDGWKPLARTTGDDAFCAALDRGEGRLIYLSVPYGMSITRQASPVVPRLF